MKKWILKIGEWGVTPESTSEQAHHFRLTNIILLCMFFGSIVQTIICYFSGAIEAALVNSTAPVVFGTGLLLMKSGYTVFARLFVLSLSFVGGYAVAAILGPASYFQFIFLFGSALSIIFFSTSERALLVFGIVGPIAGFTLLELTNYAPILGLSRASLDPSHLAIMRAGTALVIWTSLIFHFLHFTRRRRELQEYLISTAKMVGMGRMAAGIAHEVNNPLQMIVSRAERLKRTVNRKDLATAEVSKDAEYILNVAMRIGSIVKGLLALSRDASSDNMQVVDMQSILSMSLDYCRARVESKNVSLKVSEVPPSVLVRGRITQLSEVLLNVLDNACDAAVASDDKWIELKVETSDNWVDISVTDSGPGVEAKHRSKIFDPFFTTKPLGQGTGLGLSISQAIVTTHGGEIYLDGSAERTRFVIRLPRAQESAQPAIGLAETLTGATLR